MKGIRILTHGSKWKTAARRRGDPIRRRRGGKRLGIWASEVEAILRRLAGPRPPHWPEISRGAVEWTFWVLMSGHFNRFTHIGNGAQRIVASTDRRDFSGQPTAGRQEVFRNRPSGGRRRPTALTPEIRTYIETNWLADAQIAESRMCAMVNARFQTGFTGRVPSMWRNMLRILYRPPLQVQFLTEQQKDHSSPWVRDGAAMIYMADSSGRPLVIVFSNESRFVWTAIGHGSDTGGQRNATALRQMAKLLKGVTVWGAICPCYKSPLIRCSAGVGSSVYLRILEKRSFVAQCDQLSGHRHWPLPEDGAPARKASLTLTALLQAVNVLAGWPLIGAI
jgi:hypothetical protein